MHKFITVDGNNYKYFYLILTSAKLLLKLHSYLPSKRYQRQERGTRHKRIMIPQRISIHQRDAIAMQKVEIGHFEADITTVTQKSLDNVAEILNNMPRKIFGYKTPNEIWAENL